MSVPEGGPIFQQYDFLAGKCPNLGRDSLSCCRRIGEEFSSGVEICRKTLPARNLDSHSLLRVHAKGGRTLRKDVFLPSKHLLSAFYKTLPSKNLVFTESPYGRRAPSKNPSKKHLLLENL